MKNLLTSIFFSSNQFFSKTAVTFTKFLLEKCEGKFPKFPHHNCTVFSRSQCNVELREILSHRKKFRQINSLDSNFFSENITFTKFLRKKCEREFLQFPFPHCVYIHTYSSPTFFLQKFPQNKLLTM